MARTPSTMMLPLGAPLPSFRLADTTGRVYASRDYADAPALVVAFICNHCPFVKHIRAELARLGADCAIRGVAFLAINSNDAQQYPDDSPEKMALEAREAGYSFPYLFDADQSVAKAFKASCTPDFFLFARGKGLVYRGQLDDSRPAKDSPALPVTGRDLRAAIDAVLAGTPVPSDQKPSMGCNIKWKPGNEPGYVAALV